MSDTVLVELHEITFGTLEPADDVVTIVSSDAFGMSTSGGGGSALTVKDEGTSLDTAVDTIDFTGAGVTATQTSAGKIQVAVSATGTTNLSYTASTRVVASDTGTDATLTLADGSNPGLMSSADYTKLSGVESGATADMTGAEILAALLPVDGPGSGLDADTLDGTSSAGFATASHNHSGVYDPAGTAAGLISDAAYNATTWNGDTNAPTKNAVRDKIEAMGDPSTKIDQTLGDAKGDLVGFSAADTPVRVPAPTADGQLLAADSSQTSGLRWSGTIANRIGSFIFAGHSWLVYGGSGGREQGRRAEGVAGRFASMENISTTEVISLGRSGAQLTDDSAFPWIGWAGLNQLLVPPANLRRGITRTPSAPYASQPGGMFLMYLINDILSDVLGPTNNRGVYRAYGHALRSVICARRSGGNFEDTDVSRTVTDGVTTNASTSLTSATAAFTVADVGKAITSTDIPAGTTILVVLSDTQVTLSQAMTASHTGQTVTIAGQVAYSGFATTVSTGRASGKGYRKSVTNGDTFTFTLPNDFPGGTVAIQAIGTADVNTLLSGAINNSVTSITVSAFGYQTVPSSGSTLIQIDSEQMLVTAGGGTTTLTVTRGVNGTTAASHSNNAAVTGVSGANITWSGTCTGASGKAATQVSAQGLVTTTSSGTIPVVTRFTGLTAADAGTTIIGTVAGIPTTAGEQFVGFDKAMIEAPTPGPIVVCNGAKYAYGGTWALNTDARVGPMNTLIASVVAEFDSTVAVADVEAKFTSYGGTLGAAISTTNGTSITITAGANGPNAGEYIRIDTEEMFITAKSGSTYTVTRGANSTTAAIHANGAVVYNRSLFSQDNVHPSTYGHRVLAGLLKDTFGSMSLTTPQLNEANGYYRVEPQTLRSGTYLTARGQRGKLQLTNGKHAWMSLILHRPVVVTGIAAEVLTAGSSGALLRLAIAGDNGGGFVDQLIYDAGTVAATSTGKREITGFRQFLNPGVYWVGCCSQGGASTQPIVRSLISVGEGLQPPGTGDPTGDYFGAGSVRVNGTGTFTNVTTSQTFAHGLPFTPTTAEMQAGLIINATSAIASNNFATRWVESADATNFSIRFATAPTTGQTFAWSFDGSQCAAEFAKTGFTGTGITAGFGQAITAATAGEAVKLSLLIETVEPA